MLKLKQIVHLVYKKYEIQPSSYLLTTLLLVCTPALSSTFLIPRYSSVLLAYVTGFGLFYSSLASSIVAYRLGPWHPLAKYPGPRLARISKWWAVYLVRSGSSHRVMKALHDKYGDWVRVGMLNSIAHSFCKPLHPLAGPNEISVTDMSAIPEILGQDGMPRGPSKLHSLSFSNQTDGVLLLLFQCGTGAATLTSQRTYFPRALCTTMPRSASSGAARSARPP